MESLLIVVAVMVVYAAVSAPLDRRGVTSAMVFVIAGVVLGGAGLGWLDIDAESPLLGTVTELALVFLLFSDSARIDLPALRRNVTWPSRLLLIGLPLSMLAGFGIGLLLFPGLGVASVFLHGLSAMPLVAVYHRWYDSHLTRHSAAVEAEPTPMPRRRRTAVHRARAHGAEQPVEGARP